MKEHGDESMLPVFGAIFIYDLQRWQRKMERLLVKEINKHNFKLEPAETIKWKIYGKFIVEKQYKNTILYSLINGKYNFKNRKIILAAKDLLQQLKKDKYAQ